MAKPPSLALKDEPFQKRILFFSSYFEAILQGSISSKKQNV